MMQHHRDTMKTFGLATIVFASALTIIAATLKDSRPPGYAHQNWTQPHEVARDHPAPLSSRQWAFDYQPVGALIQTLTATSKSSLTIDSHTLELLNHMASALPATLSDTDIDRIEFLSRLDAPPSVAAELADTISGFLRYRQAAHRVSSSALTTEQARFEQSVALQNQYLGDYRARQLFGQQRHLKRYLLTRQAIQANPDLSAEQRQKALQRASQQFKAAAEREGAQ